MSSPLASPLTLACGVTIPNRLVKAAMTESLADEWGRSTDKLCNLYKVWSEGGSGLLITGNVQVDRRYIERPGNVCIDGPQDEKQLECLRQYAKAAQSGGSKVFVQLGHAGRQSNGMVSTPMMIGIHTTIPLTSTCQHMFTYVYDREIHSVLLFVCLLVCLLVCFSLCASCPPLYLMCLMSYHIMSYHVVAITDQYGTRWTWKRSLRYACFCFWQPSGLGSGRIIGHQESLCVCCQGVSRHRL